jgi:hypothetical protein
MGEGRHQHGADRHADNAKRQLNQAIGVIEPGHGAALSRRHHHGSNDGDLRNPAGHQAWNRQRQKAPHRSAE